MNPTYVGVALAAALGAFGWLLKYLVQSVLDGIAGLKDSIDANTDALAKFKEEADKKYARTDDYRLKWVERAFHRRSDDETGPNHSMDLLG